MLQTKNVELFVQILFLFNQIFRFSYNLRPKNGNDSYLNFFWNLPVKLIVIISSLYY